MSPRLSDGIHGSRVRQLFIGLTLGSLVIPRAVESQSKLPGRVVDVRAGEFFFQAPDTIPAGVTTFRLTQIGMMAHRLKAGLSGRALVADSGDATRGSHMLWIVRLDSGKTAGDLYETARAGDRDPAWATQLGGPGGALPPRSANATLSLAPGTYALVCYIGGAREDRSRSHFRRGIFRELAVVSHKARNTSLPRPSVRARITGEGSVTFSAPLVKGTQVIHVLNETARAAEFKFQRMRPGVTGRAFLAQSPEAGPALQWGGLGNVPAGGELLTTIDFAPGEYVLTTWPAPRHKTSRVVIIPNVRDGG